MVPQSEHKTMRMIRLYLAWEKKDVLCLSNLHEQGFFPRLMKIRFKVARETTRKIPVSAEQMHAIGSSDMLTACYKMEVEKQQHTRACKRNLAGKISITRGNRKRTKTSSFLTQPKRKTNGAGGHMIITVTRCNALITGSTNLL